MKKITAFLILVFVLVSFGCTNNIITKEEAEQKAKEYIMPQIEETAKLFSKGELGADDAIYILESYKEGNGYCVEFAFSYRKEMGISARDLHSGAPSTIPLFVNNRGIVEEDNFICIYNAYPELK